MTPDAATSEGIEARLLLDAIFLRYGYDLRDYAACSLNRRLLTALSRSGCGHLGELQHRLLADPELFAQVLDDLAIGVSGWFRDPALFSSVRERVFPLLRTYPLLKIWHAGCSTGEEVYSLAMLLSEAGIYDRCQLYATDLRERALEDARRGVYPLEGFEALEADYLRAGGKGSVLDHGSRAYGHYAVREGLRRNIHFFHHDLVSDQVFGEMHLIVCQNVFIYFNRSLKARVLEKFAASLCPGGFLCLGASERPLETTLAALFQEVLPNNRILRRSPL